MPNKPKVILHQYVSYRYGDLMGFGFTYSNKVGSKISRQRGNKSQIIEKLTKEDLQGLFKDIIAISIVNQDKQAGREGKVFAVFKAGEEMDV